MFPFPVAFEKIPFPVAFRKIPFPVVKDIKIPILSTENEQIPVPHFTLQDPLLSINFTVTRFLLLLLGYYSS